MMWHLLKKKKNATSNLVVAWILDFLQYQGFKNPAKQGNQPRPDLLVRESQEAFQAAVSCRRQGVHVPLHADGLQPRTHGPLRQTHLWHHGHAHLRANTRLHHGAGSSVRAERRAERRAVWRWHCLRVVEEAAAIETSHRTCKKIGCVTNFLCLFFFFFVPVPSGAAQGPRIANEFVQHVQYLAEGRPLCSLPLPAVEHQLVQHHRTVHWSGQTVALFYRFDYLKDEHKTQKWQEGLSTCWKQKSKSIYIDNDKKATATAHIALSNWGFQQCCLQGRRLDRILGFGLRNDIMQKLTLFSL